MCIAALALAAALGACGEEAPGKGTPGVATGFLVVNNQSAKDAAVYIDGDALGEVAAGDSVSFEGDFAGEHELYALATDDSAWWGPVTVTIDKGYTHTWNLWDASEGE